MHGVITSFRNQGTEDIFDGKDSSAARKICPPEVWRIAQRKLDQVNRVKTVRELSAPPGNRLEYLKGNRAGQYSIRINDRYRICFKWKLNYAYEVEITDYH